MSTDATIMLRRNFKHTVRNPVTVFNAVLFPIVLLLMFVYVIGGAFDVGVKYVDYLTPGIIILTICYGLSGTAVAVNSDMTKGIINRFKVMDISRSAVLSAHVAATLLRSLIAIAALIGVAFAMGFRPAASGPEWLGAIGLIVLVSFATSWFTVALGLAAKTPESAGRVAGPLGIFPLLRLPLGPAGTGGPGGRHVADYSTLLPPTSPLPRPLLATPPP